MRKPETMDQARHKLLHADVDLRLALEKSGDRLAKKMKWRKLDGFEAIVRFLVDKHHWFPEDVRRLTTEELDLLLSGELED